MKHANPSSKQHHIWRNIHLNRSRMMLFFTLLILAFLLFINNIFPYASVGLILIPLSYGLGIYTYQKNLAWYSGLEGEQSLTKYLKKLSDDYCQITNVIVPPNRGDTDYIIAGPNGLFVIEAKNLTGNIKCQADSWSRQKTGRGGNSYELEIGSPSNQVKRNAKVLKDFILSHKKEVFKRDPPHIWVESIVCFTNTRADLALKKPTVHIIDPKDIADFILNHESEASYTKEEIEKICTLIQKNSKPS